MVGLISRGVTTKCSFSVRRRMTMIGDATADLRGDEPLVQIVDARDGLALEADDDVALPDARERGRAAGFDFPRPRRRVSTGNRWKRASRGWKRRHSARPRRSTTGGCVHP